MLCSINKWKMLCRLGKMESHQIKHKMGSYCLTCWYITSNLALLSLSLWMSVSFRDGNRGEMGPWEMFQWRRVTYHNTSLLEHRRQWHLWGHKAIMSLFVIWNDTLAFYKHYEVTEFSQEPHGKLLLNVSLEVIGKSWPAIFFEHRITRYCLPEYRFPHL